MRSGYEFRDEEYEYSLEYLNEIGQTDLEMGVNEEAESEDEGSPHSSHLSDPGLIYPRFGFGRVGFGELDLEYEEEAEITGTDDSRSPIRNTTKTPYRWICRLKISWRATIGKLGTPINVGTGILVGPKHVLTAAHNVHSRESGTASEVTVDPGRDRHVLPFGSAKMSRFDVLDNWRYQFDSCYDYALITLDREIANQKFNGKPLGYWGSPEYGDNTTVGLGSMTESELTGKTVHMAGYPKDKCEYLAIQEFKRGAKCQYDQLPLPGGYGSGTPEARRHAEVSMCLGGSPWDKRATAQFGAKGKVLRFAEPMNAQILLHDIDSCEGQSGGPVWLEVGRTRYLVGVHTGTFGKQGYCPDPGRGGFSERNRAILMSKAVRTKIGEWRSKS